MNLENSVIEHSSGLTSLRSTDRKKSAETLKDLLSRNALGSLLTENTLKKKGFTWNDLFNDINEYILKETEKYETSKTFENVTSPLCSSLLHMCVAGCIKGRAYIKYDKIFEAAFNILKDTRLTRAVGDSYLNLLYKHVLSCDHYLGYITPVYWEELLEVCMDIFLGINSKLDTYTKMRIISLVIKNGIKYSQFTIPLRDSLSKIKKCFSLVQNDKKVQEVVVEVMTMLMETLSTEFRLTMCEFSENLMSMIFKFYEHSLEQKKKSSLFRLLDIIVTIHHPSGKLFNEDGSLANNWDTWNRQLNSISEIVSLEIGFLEKHRKQIDSSMTQYSNFLSLAAAVYFQIFNSGSDIIIDSESTSKRQKVAFNKFKTFADIIHKLHNNHLPWLGIVHIYVKKHQHSVDVSDYLALVKCMITLQTNQFQDMDWEALIEIVDISIQSLTPVITSTSSCDHDELHNSLLSLWNSCVRNCISSSTDRYYHLLLQMLLKTKMFKDTKIQPLIKLYLERNMIVKNSSVRTLNTIIEVLFNKYSSFNQRMDFLDWYLEGDITAVDMHISQELIIRLISNENVTLGFLKTKTERDIDHLFDILFCRIDECILFSEFDYKIPIAKHVNESSHDTKYIEVNDNLNKSVQDFLHSKLLEHTDQITSKEINNVFFLRIVLSYFDIIHKSHILEASQISELKLFTQLKKYLSLIFTYVTNCLKSNSPIPHKIQLLRELQSLFIDDYSPFLSVEIRKAVQDDFFYSININLNAEDATDEDLIFEGDETDLNARTLKYHCVYVMAAYCRKKANYRDELLDLILDPTLYDFTCAWDMNCAYKAIEILNDPGAEDPPLEPVFVFMQYLCKELFRSPRATYELLTIFLKIFKTLWMLDNKMKQNCFIMIRGYIERCEKLFYPPKVAALIYKCAAEMILLNNKELTHIDDVFIKAIRKKTKGDTHCLRLYCCYLLKNFIQQVGIDTDEYLFGLTDIFTVNVSEKKQTILKDESMNRTVTLLHNYLAISHSKNSSIRTIFNYALQVLKEKNLDVQLVKKVLNIITVQVTKKNLSSYFNKYILSILNSWFRGKFKVNELPLQLFGIDNLSVLLENHMQWVVSADMLWCNDGNLKVSNILKQTKEKLGTTESKIIEACFCNIIVLCLPYIVADKYKLRNVTTESQSRFEKSSISAHRMFQMTRDVLENEKWSNLFVENIGELLLLTATHLNDPSDATNMFHLEVPMLNETYQYPKHIFSAILKYFGELTDGDIMQYLCENQPVAIFKILLKLWENVLQEEVFIYKVVCLHAFVTFSENIPMVTPSENFVCNYVCNCFVYAIKKSQCKDEVRVFNLGLKNILERLLPDKIDILRNVLARVLSILIIKKEEGFGNECTSLLNYLMIDMKDYLKEGQDVVDYLRSFSQSSAANACCFSLDEFCEKLKTYKLGLICPSHETLCNLQEFLKSNKHYINYMWSNISSKGFSEECGTSVVHQIIHQLNVILSTISDSKSIIVACNCLAEIGIYDLKTLITVPPPDTSKVITLPPKQSFAQAVVYSLSNFLFDEDPMVTNKITKTLHCLFKFRDGLQALDSNENQITVLKPFATEQEVTSAEFKIDTGKFNEFAKIDFILPSKIESHTVWLRKLTVTILDIFVSETNYANPLKDVCYLKPEFGREVLPYLIGLLLSSSTEKHIHTIGKQINRFFKYIWEKSFDDRIESSGDSNTSVKINNILDQNHRQIIQYMLDVVDLVRLQRTHYKTRPSRLEMLNYLNLEYDKVAWASTVANQHLTAIYYGELWAASQNDGVPPSSPEATSALVGGTDLQRILRKSFVSIGELDAIDGCGTAHLTNDEEKRRHLVNTGQYTDALLLHDIAMSSSHGDLEMQSGTVRSLHKSGMHHLALQYIKSLPESDELNDIKYECLSYLGDWSEFVDTRELEAKSIESSCNTQSILKAFRYGCLKDCLNIDMKPAFENKLEQTLNRAKLAVSRLAQKLNMENCQNFYRVLSKLHLFSDIEDYFEVRNNKLPFFDLLHKWRVQNLPAYHDFKHLEDLVSQRNLILEHAAKVFNDSLKDIVSLQLQYAELSLSNQRIQMAQRLVAAVKNLQKSEEVTLMESQISWAKGHQDIALSLMRNIVVKPSTSTDLTQRAISLRQYGLWMAESKSDNPRDIIYKYLIKSLQILNQTDDVKFRLKVYFDIAKFADAEYKQVQTYMSSSIFENKVKCLENMKDTASSLKSTQTSQMTRDERKALLTNERFKQLDEAEIASTRAEKECFLHLAMRYYLLSLKESEDNNLSVFRVISLWLDNPSLVLDSTEGGSFEELLHSIPSRKFITVLPQLTPRLSDENTPFAVNLRKILERCAIEHPHHTLPILFSLKNSDKDKHILNVGGDMRAVRAQEPRVVAATSLVRSLSAANSPLAVIIAQMEKLCDATISFANYKPKVKEQRQKIPAAEKILKLLNLDAIPIPTVTMPVRFDCNYENICSLVTFDNYFELVGGINCPKKINCKGSDGRKKILLIKGEDDLRQDAVMQQVFNIVNTLLENNSITSKNNLLIRTYKVVPMSRQSGVLEWCEGTIPIGSYLVGSANNGAHARYRPQDISCSVARQKLAKCHELRKSNKDKLAVFLSILKEFKPVFHYFFTEHYLDPVTWYERRLAYTKSVATSSMVGYILGLGDRHVQNILIDKKTAEVIHIDFGIAFDQGKALPTPETIPFRLTQDIIAGFGCSGVEGLFRRSCEKTMQLLRDNQETLLTILEVLLCDPLYSWTVTPHIVPASSKDATVCGTGSISGLAERALLAVGSKLSGTESAAGGVSVAGHVARLLLMAADPANLCRLFPGWQPYL